jgi:hypothetical protein
VKPLYILPRIWCRTAFSTEHPWGLPLLAKKPSSVTAKRSGARATPVLCAIALAVGCRTPAAAFGPSDPASSYYAKCVAPSRGAAVPNEICDAPINEALTGIVIGQFDQERPAFCYPRNLVEQTQALEHHPGQAPRATSKLAHQMLVKMRVAVAQYMRGHSERLSESTLEVIIAALLHTFSCPG